MSKIIELLAHYPPLSAGSRREMVPRYLWNSFYQQRYQLTVPQWRLMMVLGPTTPSARRNWWRRAAWTRYGSPARSIVWWKRHPVHREQRAGQAHQPGLLHPAGLTLFQQLKTEAGSWQHTLTDYLPAEARQSIRLHLQSVSDAIEQLHLLDNEQPS